MNYLKLNIEFVHGRKAGVMAKIFRTIRIVKPALLCYGIHCLIVFGAAVLDGSNLQLEPGGFINPELYPSLLIIDRFMRWDAHWYTYVAQQGYDLQSIVFFPVTVTLIRLVALLFESNYSLAGFLVCNVFALLSFIAIFQLFRLDLPPDTSIRALLAYSVFPTSFYLNSIYTEPIFITFATATLYFARSARWPYAGIFSIFAALTRNIGVFLAIFIMVEIWQQQKSGRSSKKDFCWAVASPLALLGFMAYNHWLVDDWLAFINSQKLWGREFSTPWNNIWSSIMQIYHALPYPQPGLVLDFTLTIGCLVGMLVLTFSSRFTVTKSLLVIGWMWFLIPLFSSASWMPLYSMSRFVLVVVPIYIWIAQFSKGTYLIVVALSAAALAFFTILFTNWHWIS